MAGQQQSKPPAHRGRRRRRRNGMKKVISLLEEIKRGIRDGSLAHLSDASAGPSTDPTAMEEEQLGPPSPVFPTFALQQAHWERERSLATREARLRRREAAIQSLWQEIRPTANRAVWGASAAANSSDPLQTPNPPGGGDEEKDGPLLECLTGLLHLGDNGATAREQGIRDRKGDHASTATPRTAHQGAGGWFEQQGAQQSDRPTDEGGAHPGLPTAPLPLLYPPSTPAPSPTRLPSPPSPPQDGTSDRREATDAAPRSSPAFYSSPSFTMRRADITPRSGSPTSTTCVIDPYQAASSASLAAPATPPPQRCQQAVRTPGDGEDESVSSLAAWLARGVSVSDHTDVVF
ncbi:uncharacterized protein PSFLO_01395 [Pseudozyma flocculosa]|uniref:Uncharacterized protein n=1 Tax=Pseudozyma flocculosa TaxID=84751 RepID=A0A5C3EUA4_9BASI|nr:uncharacterized protein PSFLO_01395 [Pseudozyma flocculosa]